MSERIAVLRFSSLGDILCTGPAVRGLRARFPDADIVFVTSTPYRELAEMLPGVSSTVALRPRGHGFVEDAAQLAARGPWSRVVDLQGSRRSARLVRMMAPARRLTDTPPRVRRGLFLATRLKVGGFPAVPERMLNVMREWGVSDDGGSLRVTVPEQAQQSLRDRWGHTLDGAAVLVPGAKHRTKQWPGSYWAELFQMIPRDQRVIVAGARGDMPAELSARVGDRLIDLTGATSLPELAALLQRAGVVVSGDTGPMHLAVATGAPLVALYGPTVREFGFFPFRHGRAEVLERPLGCRPCSPHGSRRCPLGHHRCLRDINPSHVRSAMERALGTSSTGKTQS